MPRDTTTPTAIAQRQKRVLRKEFSDFFTHMLTAEPGWPAVPEQAFIDALADSLLEMAKRTGKQPTAYLQTLVIELQDRVNDQLKG